MGGQNEGGFSEEQLDMYKDCFKLMDINKDGTIDKNDLRGAFDNVGVLMTEGELDGLLGEINGACTYQNMVNMFQEKMAGDGNDSDDLIIQAFKAYDVEGMIDVKMFQHALRTRASPRRRRRRRRRPPSKCCYDHPHYSQTKACELRTSAMVPYVAILSPGNFIKSKINICLQTI